MYSTELMDRTEILKADQSCGMECAKDSKIYPRKKCSQHCKLCTCAYGCMSNLNLHEKDCKEKLHLDVNDTHTTTHISGRFKCKVCDKDKEKEKAHLCDKDVQQDIHLVTPMGTPTDKKQYNCEECGKHFTTNSKLTIHMRTHTGEKPYYCKYCDKQFSTTSYLNVHIRTHTGEKPYKCKYCDKQFTQNNNLNIHMRTHGGKF